MVKKYLVMVTFNVLLFLIPENLYAVFHEQMAITTKAISLANAVTANPPGIMAIHYNPAGLSLLPEGKVFENGITLAHIEKTSSFEQAPDFPGFMSTFKEDPIDGKSGTNSNGVMFIPIYNGTIDFVISPAIGATYREKDSKWTYGVGQYAPFAVGLAHNDSDDPARYGGKKVFNQHMVYLAPSASYRVNDKLSFGVTIGMGQTSTGITMDMRAPSEILALTKVLGDATKDGFLPIITDMTYTTPWFGGGIGPYEQIGSIEMELKDDFSPNYNLGVLWEPKSWFSFGLCYQSPIKVHFNGSYKFEYSEQWQKVAAWNGQGVNMPWTVLSPPQVAKIFNLPDTPIKEQKGKVYSDFEYPQRIQMGVKLTPIKPVRFMFDVQWSDWSVMKEDKFVFDQDIQLLQFVKMTGYTGGDNAMALKRDMEDTIHWSSGVELQIFKWLCFRMGYEKRPTSVQDNRFDLTFCLPDMDVYGAGIGMKFENGLEIDLGASYLVNEEYVVDRDSSTNMNSENWTKPVYNPYAGLIYTQQTKTYLASFTLRAPLDLMMEIMKKPVHIFDKLAFWK